MLGPKSFFSIAEFVPDAAAVHPNSIKIVLVNGVSTFFINGKPALINGLRNPTLWQPF